ncbi:plastocyanin [Salinarchaeum sp. Harcht-Bsk1]|uniref:halocyanin domain-containing protein n=1 Tax=Salinarchaeum sp. Harcht-Bsk1 TaxID=1333523 RepID=UPI000342383E|nr:halocyanin domain-containing protein [Salinarchaeum sp. Harcht-Bsk1]AGN00694.1 plastocyanin [Salinarchaeum sp. Harcht-Bsk1]
MNHERRRFLQIGGAAAVAAIAGCTGDSNDGDDSGNGTNSVDGSAGGGTTDGDSGFGSGDGAEFDFGGWLADTDNYDGTTVDERGASSVTIQVGAEANGGAFGFAPPAVWVDPGTDVVWEWTGDGGSHNVVAESGAEFRSGDPTGDAGTTFSQRFDDTGIVTYYCNPHRDMGMKGAVVVGEPEEGAGENGASAYGFQAASMDAYWYSLYNMSTNIAMSGNGVPFPLNDQMEELQDQRMPAMLEAADVDRPPIANPNLSLAAFTEGDPHFTQEPVLEDDTGRPDASTLGWDKSQSSGVVSPSSVAWTHLKGVTWAKNFQAHFDVLPTEMAPKFRAQLLSTLAQVGINAAILVGGSRENGALTHGDSWEFLSQYRPSAGEIVDDSRRPHHHAAMVWFLSDMTSLAQNGWFGYENPRPLLPKAEGADAVFDPPVGIQEITDGVAATTMDLFTPAEIVEQESTRSVGLMLAAIGYYGPQAGGEAQRNAAAQYANDLASVIEDTLTDDGRVENGAANQAATQGIVAQGLLWASQLDGVDHADTADRVVDFLIEELWDENAGTFASGTDDATYTITARDAGDLTGGLNAADVLLERSDVQETFARFFDQTFNRGELQRAERPPSRDESAEHTLPLPPAAGGEFGQAAVYNGAVEYDPAADEWTVTDDRFYTEEALYLANQDIWVGNWAGDFYQGRGVPGESDSPP